MQTLKKLAPILIVWVLMSYVIWATSDAFVVGFDLGAHAAFVIHSLALLFVALFLFSFFSGRFMWAYHIRFLYKLFNILVGLLFYFFPASFVLAITLAIHPLSVTHSVLISSIAAYTALVLGLIGLLQARCMKVKRYTITLPHLPHALDGKSIVVVSDTHFGLVNFKNFSKRVIKKIDSLTPHFILHAGDFYDGPKVDTAPITRAWRTLAEKYPVFYAPGNHEHYGDYKQFIMSLKDANVKVLEDQMVIHEGIQIIGVDYRSAGKKLETKAVLEGLHIDRSMPSILINHPPSFHTEAMGSGTSLMVSGHTHRGQFWPINYIVWMIYKKFIYGLHKVGEMYALTTSGVGTAGPPLRLFNTPEVVLITLKQN